MWQNTHLVRTNQDARIYLRDYLAIQYCGVIFCCQVGEQVEAFVTYVTPEGHVFVQIPGGGTMRLHELMEDIAEHYSGVNLMKNYNSTIVLFYNIRATEPAKYALVLHCRTRQKYGWKAQEKNGHTAGYTLDVFLFFKA